MQTLNTLFLAELADIYDAGKRYVKALPRISKAATCSDLRGAIQDHFEETKRHVSKLEEIFACFDLKPKGATCEATMGILKETDGVIEEFKGSPAINAALIAALGKVEHYKIASYGSLHDWAGLLGRKKASSLLKGILNEEKDAKKSLKKLARSKSNLEAMAEPAGAGR
jgi:ferritin-like metal-binding protein YciE